MRHLISLGQYFRQMKYRFVSIIILCVSITTASKAQVKSSDLKLCDLLFVSNQNSELSKAIDDVTQSGTVHHFVHIGMIASHDTNFTVLHADSDGGVQEESLRSFIKNQGKVHAYRVKNLDTNWGKSAIEFARKSIGQPYKFSYILSDTGYYCSEYIYKIFESKEIFKMNPMTFKNPNSDEYNATWVKHYKDLGLKIPEGELGCNPNGMSTSDKITYLGRVSNSQNR